SKLYSLIPTRRPRADNPAHVAVSPDGGTILVSFGSRSQHHAGNMLWFWDAQTHDLRSETDCALGKRREQITKSGRDRLHSMKTRSMENSISGIGFIGNGSQAVTAASAGLITRWDMKSGKQLSEIDQMDTYFCQARMMHLGALSPDGHKIAVEDVGVLD